VVYERKVDFPTLGSPRSKIVTSGVSAMVKLHFVCIWLWKRSSKLYALRCDGKRKVLT
jgi:hypothetical protein